MSKSYVGVPLETVLSHTSVVGKLFFKVLLDDVCECGSWNIAPGEREAHDWAFFLCWRATDGKMFWKYYDQTHAHEKLHRNVLDCRRGLCCGEVNDLLEDARSWCERNSQDFFSFQLNFLSSFPA